MTQSTRATRPTLPGLATRIERFRMWLKATAEIEDMTRDHEREDRIRAEIAVRLDPGPWHLVAYDHSAKSRRRHDAGSTRHNDTT